MQRETLERFLQSHTYDNGGYIHALKKRFYFKRKEHIVIVNDMVSILKPPSIPIPIEHIEALTTSRPSYPHRLPTNPKPQVHG